jgi:hypothetical protein
MMIPNMWKNKKKMFQTTNQIRFIGAQASEGHLDIDSPISLKHVHG